MLQFFYDTINTIYNWQYFGITSILWVSVDVLWISKWQALLSRIRRLITKPSVFSIDEDIVNDSKYSLIYPRSFLEDLAQRKETKKTTLNSEETFFSKQREEVFNKKYPLRTPSYIVFLLFFLLFIWADSIVVSQTLELMGFRPDFLPEQLNKLEVALLAGAVFAAALGIWMWVETSGDSERPSKNLPLEDFSRNQLGILGNFSRIIVAISFLVAIAFSFQRLIELGTIESTATVEIILSFILYGLVAINCFIAAAITLTYALQGILVILYLVSDILTAILPLLSFILDIIWRIVHILLDIVIWFLFTPILAIPELIRLFVRTLFPPKVGG